MLNNPENQSFFAGLKHAFFGSKSADKTPEKPAEIGRPIECTQFVDYPVFDIDGKEYSVDLEGSKMMKDAYEYLDSFPETNGDFILIRKRTYAVPSLNKYLALTISLACESAEYSGKISYVVTHMGIEKAYLLDKAEDVEPEPVTELH